MPFLEGGECYISSETIFQGEFSDGCCKSYAILEGESVIYHLRLFFEENSAVTVARADLYLF